MYFILKDENIHYYANNPSDNVIWAIKKAHPDAAYYRSLEPCLNEFAALANATKAEQDPETEQEIDDGEGGVTTITVPGQVHLVPIGNTFAIEDGPVVVVRSPEGEPLLCIPLELVAA